MCFFWWMWSHRALSTSIGWHSDIGTVVYNCGLSIWWENTSYNKDCVTSPSSYELRSCIDCDITVLLCEITIQSLTLIIHIHCYIITQSHLLPCYIDCPYHFTPLWQLQSHILDFYTLYVVWHCLAIIQSHTLTCYTVWHHYTPL